MSQRQRSIAIDARYLSNKSTGINMYLKALIRLLVQHGYDITLVLNEQPPEHFAALDACKVVVLKRNRLRLDVLWEQWSLPIWLYRNKFTAYWAPGNKGLPLWYVGRTKLLLTVHDLIPFHFPRMYFKKQPVVMLLYFPSIVISLLRAQRIMTVSSATATDVKRLFHRRSTPFMLPLRHMGILDADLPKQPHRKHQIVYNGGTDPRKNLPLLLQAFAVFAAKHPSYKLLLMGGGMDAFAPQIEALGLGEKVVRTGYVTQEEKMRLLAESEAVVYPSLMEGYGLPIVEALMAGIPIICGAGGSQREVAGKAGVVLDPVTAEAIARELENVANGRTRRTYGQHAKAQLASLAGIEHEETIVRFVEDALGAKA